MHYKFSLSYWLALYSIQNQHACSECQHIWRLAVVADLHCICNMTVQYMSCHVMIALKAATKPMELSPLCATAVNDTEDPEGAVMYAQSMNGCWRNWDSLL